MFWNNYFFNVILLYFIILKCYLPTQIQNNKTNTGITETVSIKFTGISINTIQRKIQNTGKT